MFPISRLAIFALTLCLAWPAPGPAPRAATIGLVTSPEGHGAGVTLTLKGVISEGDVGRVEDLVAIAAREGRAGAIHTIRLSSEGGSWQEGVALARLFRERGIGTRITAGETCRSACAIAFLGGTHIDASGGRVPARAMHPTATLAFHAPYLSVANRVFLITDMERAYTRAVESMLAIFILGEELGLQTRTLSELLVRGRDVFVEIDTIDEAGRLGIFVDGLAPPVLPRAVAMRRYCAAAYAWGAGTSALSEDGHHPPPGSEEIVRAGAYRLVPLEAAGGGPALWCVVRVGEAAGAPDEPFVCLGFARAARPDAITNRLAVAPSPAVALDAPCAPPVSVDPLAPSAAAGLLVTALLPPEARLRDAAGLDEAVDETPSR